MSSEHSPRTPHVTPLAEGLTSRWFTPSVQDGQADAQSAAYVRSVEWGFYEQWLSDEHVNRLTQAHVEDGRQHLGVYVDPGFAALEPWGETYESIGFAAEHPVGTFVHYDKTLNAGGPEPLRARLISDVTVNPSFRRRGILKHMMTDCLAQTVKDGVPVAALTVSEGGIYGRFGFGMATRHASIQVNVGEDNGSPLQLRGEPVGHVLPVDPSRADDALTQLWETFHRTQRGSIGRQYAYWKFGTARWNPEDITSWHRASRVAVHILPDGTIGGMVWFKHQGWDTEPTTVRVLDLLAADPTSYAELWRYLSTLDLVRRLTFQRAPVEDPLLHLCANPHSYRVKGIDEHLWLRILDPVQALQGRQWGADGEFSISLQDPLDIASGVFTVSVSGGIGQVSAAEGARTPQHFSLDVETLSTLYLGDASVLTLRDAGRITGSEDADWTALAATVDLPTAPFCATHF